MRIAEISDDKCTLIAGESCCDISPSEYFVMTNCNNRSKMIPWLIFNQDMQKEIYDCCNHIFLSGNQIYGYDINIVG